MDFFDVFGVIYLVIATVIAVAVSAFAFLYLAHPNDTNFPAAYIVKSLIIAGMSVVVFLQFMLPLDIFSNSKE